MTRQSISTSARVWGAAAVLLLGFCTPLSATPFDSWFGSDTAKPAADAVDNDTLKEIQQALDEERYLDAGKLMDEGLAAAPGNPHLLLMAGQLSLARGQFTAALTVFKGIDADPDVRASALEGEGIALSALGRSKEAMDALQTTVQMNPGAWRAWNALGAEFDKRRDWAQAEAAYDHALSNSDHAATALNNRGFSRLLQNRFAEAATDFIEALQKKPDFASARDNLRLTLAMEGEYDQSVSGASREDHAAALNNAGFVAMLRGDYAKAEELLSQAMKEKGEYYARASANLEMTHSLEARHISDTTNGSH